VAKATQAWYLALYFTYKTTLDQSLVLRPTDTYSELYTRGHEQQTMLGESRLIEIDETWLNLRGGPDITYGEAGYKQEGGGINKESPQLQLGDKSPTCQ
jgi:hypothetical protein